MSFVDNLAARLGSVLPQGVQCRLYHISTPPHPVSAIYAPAPSRPEDRTLSENHFLAIGAPAETDRGELLVFAIEVLIFTTFNSTTVFVSKADSTGFTSKLAIPAGSPSIISSISATFLDFLLRPRLDGKRLVLSLFARAQNQYLFPGSIENASKHVLDDRQLIKWWGRVFDVILRKGEHEESDGEHFQRATAHVVVPGCDKGETRLFFPRSSRLDNTSQPRWINSYPVELLVDRPAAPPRCLIPRLPDDPKSRFLDDLDGEHINEDGRWRSVKNLDQFWELMSYRQECSAGRLVGFIWLVFPQSQSIEMNGVHAGSEVGQQEPQLPTPGHSQVEANCVTADSISIPETTEHEKELASPPPSSPPARIIDDAEVESFPTFEPQDAQRAKQDNVTSEDNRDVTQAPFSMRWPESTRGEVIISSDKYQDILDEMLQTDFAGITEAAKSTAAWITKVGQLNQGKTWGRTITGSNLQNLHRPDDKNTPPVVNVISGIRKKRKAEESASIAVPVNTAEPASNILSASLIRKRPKP